MLAVAYGAVGTSAHAFGQEGAFQPRLLSVGGQKVDALRRSAASRWSWELVRRTSAPARLVVAQVAADSNRLLDEPFVVWTGEREVSPLTGPELRGLAQYLQLGGIIFVDDANPALGLFGKAARRELRRVLPEAPVVELDQRHVLFKSYYLLEGPSGRVLGPTKLEAMIRGRDVQVMFCDHDLLGALARTEDGEGQWAFDMDGGAQAREMSVRFAVNVAMYTLCSDYKDDQVHVEELMRRRGRRAQ